MAAFQHAMREEAMDYQVVPPHVHRRNAAKRAIWTFKNYFIAGLCSIDPNFSLQLWDRLLRLPAPSSHYHCEPAPSFAAQPATLLRGPIKWSVRLQSDPTCTPGNKVIVHETSSVC
jgi:hypothetical protein